MQGAVKERMPGGSPIPDKDIKDAPGRHNVLTLRRKRPSYGSSTSSSLPKPVEGRKAGYHSASKENLDTPEQIA